MGLVFRHQCSDFLLCEMPEVAFGKRPESQWTDGNPHEPEHLNAKRGEQAANLAVLPLIEHDLQPTILLALAQHRDALRLQNITIGYTFDLPRFVGAARGSRMFFSADNLALWTNYSGYDPEVHTQLPGLAPRGIDYLHYPRPRTYTGGFRVAF